MVTGQLRAMTTLIGRAWVPIVMAIVLAVRAFTVFRFQGGLFRRFGYVGPTASSMVTGIVFSHNVTDSGE
jgi:hypothetical protein